MVTSSHKTPFPVHTVYRGGGVKNMLTEMNFLPTTVLYFSTASPSALIIFIPLAPHISTFIITTCIKKFHENRTFRCRVMTKKRCFPIWRRSAVLNSKLWFTVPNFMIFETEICRHNVFHIFSRPPSWICDDVIMLHLVIDFHAAMVLNFHVDWFGSFCRPTGVTYVRQTDRQTDIDIAIA